MLCSTVSTNSNTVHLKRFFEHQNSSQKSFRNELLDYSNDNNNDNDNNNNNSEICKLVTPVCWPFFQELQKGYSFKLIKTV